jgi:hypothetical protein
MDEKVSLKGLRSCRKTTLKTFGCFLCLPRFLMARKTIEDDARELRKDTATQLTH